MSWAHGPGCAAGLVALALAGAALAQVPSVRPPTDAGRQLEDSRTGGAPRPPSPAPRLDVPEPVRPALTAPDSFRVQVKGFRITGATVFTEDQLKPLLAAYVGRELSLADLEEAAAVISRFYRDRGYFVARAYVPAQEIRDGVVEITVLEGRLGSFKIFLAPESRDALSPPIVRRILSANQPPGSVIESGRLERGLLILSDTPGVAAKATLSPGSELGTSDLAVDVSDTPEFTGSADADNFGNRYTGAGRVGATAYLNSPTGSGDLGTVRAQASTGSQNARFGYQYPVGYNGLRVGAAFSYVQYKLCCEFDVGEGSGGEATDLTATAQYPIVRSRDINVYGTVSGAGRHFINRFAGITTSDKTTRLIILGVVIDSRDDAGGGGLNGFSVAVTTGKLNLSGSPSDLSIDAITAQADGGYTKLSYSLSRLQRLGYTTSFYASLSGQLASKNLDSSEQFTLGGPTAVRAYPTGEAIGDEGVLGTLEARWQFADDWQAAIFNDWGKIRLHKKEWLGWQGANTTITNTYSLDGLGLGLTYARPGNLVVHGILARKIGTNPGANASGNDADNRDVKIRGWIQLIKFF